MLYNYIIILFVTRGLYHESGIIGACYFEVDWGVLRLREKGISVIIRTWQKPEEIENM